MKKYKSIFFQFSVLFFMIIAIRRLLTYLLSGYQSQSTVLGAKSLLRPSFTSPSGSGHSGSANQGTHHEIFWNRQVVRHDQGPRRNQTGSRRERPPLRNQRDPVGQECRPYGRSAPQL